MEILKDGIVDNHDWCFVSGKVNALESSLFNPDDLERLLNSETIDDLHKYITHSKLKKYFPDREDIYNYEKTIDSYFIKDANEIKALSPSTRVCDAFLLRYNLRDMKNIIKKNLSGPLPEGMTSLMPNESGTDLLLSEGVNMNEMIPDELLPDIREIMLENINNLRRLCECNKDLPEHIIFWIVDLILDYVYLCYLSGIINQITTHCVKEYIRNFIFINIIKSVLRITHAGINMELYMEYFLRGALSLVNLSRLAGLPVAEWKCILKNELPSETAQDIISVITDEDGSYADLTRLEKILDDYLIDIIRPAKNIAFGPARIFGYLCGMEAERYNLKLLIGGKISSVENQLLRDRMRICYV